MIDSGADISVVSDSFFNSVAPKAIKPMTRDKKQLAHCTSASGDDFANLGKATLEFEINKVPFRHQIQVLKGLSKPVLLGSDFLIKHKALVDFHGFTMRIGKHVFPMGNEHQSRPQLYLMKTDRKVQLKPNTSTVFSCRVPRHIPPGSYQVRPLDIAEGFQDQPGIAIANAVVQINNSPWGTLMAVNETNSKHLVPRNAVVAALELVSASEICNVTVSPDLERLAEAQPKAVDLDLDKAQRLNELLEEFNEIFT